MEFKNSGAKPINKKPRVSFIHGRLGPHIMHGRLAKSIGGEFQMVDKYKIWNDREYGKLYTIFAWFYNAFAFKKPESYDYFLVSGPHFSPIIMKIFRLKKRQKVMVHLGDETMYFLYDRWYSPFMRKLLVTLLNQYDVLLCEGQMANDLAGLNGINKPLRFTTYLGVPKERLNKLLEVKPRQEVNHFIFISTGPGGWRTYYKGIDLMIESFSKAFNERDDLRFSIVGKWNEDVQEDLLKNCSKACQEAITFLGHTNDIDALIKEGCFYLHTARGDAFPTVVLEAMTAGLIPLISEWTGSKEYVKKVNESFIIPLDQEVVTRNILRFADFTAEERKSYSDRSREVAKEFTEEFALKHYRDTFETIQKEVHQAR